VLVGQQVATGGKVTGPESWSASTGRVKVTCWTQIERLQFMLKSYRREAGSHKYENTLHHHHHHHRYGGQFVSHYFHGLYVDYAIS
jgi:hypothetical protein